MTYSTVVSPHRAATRSQDDPREVRITGAGIQRGLLASRNVREAFLRHADEMLNHIAAIEELHRLLPENDRYTRACAYARVLMRMKEHSLRLDASKFGGEA